MAVDVNIQLLDRATQQLLSLPDGLPLASCGFHSTIGRLCRFAAWPAARHRRELAERMPVQTAVTVFSRRAQCDPEERGGFLGANKTRLEAGDVERGLGRLSLQAADHRRDRDVLLRIICIMSNQGDGAFTMGPAGSALQSGNCGGAIAAFELRDRPRCADPRSSPRT